MTRRNLGIPLIDDSYNIDGWLNRWPIQGRKRSDGSTTFAGALKRFWELYTTKHSSSCSCSSDWTPTQCTCCRPWQSRVNIMGQYHIMHSDTLKPKITLPLTQTNVCASPPYAWMFLVSGTPLVYNSYFVSIKRTHIDYRMIIYTSVTVSLSPSLTRLQC